jgi:hypothetical protein
MLGSGDISSRFLTSTLDGSKRSASRTERFIPKKIASGAPWIGGWVSHRDHLDTVEKRNYFPEEKWSKCNNRKLHSIADIVPKTKVWNSRFLSYEEAEF